MTTNRVLACTLLVLLAGCQSPRKEAARFDFAKKQCVQSLEALPVSNVPRRNESDKSARLKLDFQKAAGCINAKDGKPVPILLLALDGKVPSEINVGISIEREIAFASALDLLDAQYQLVRSIPFADFTKRGGSYTLSVFLNDSDQAVRFIALRPDRGTVGKTDASIVGKRNETFIAVAAASTLYYSNFVTGSEQVAKTWHSEVGRLEVVLKDYAPPAVKPR
jgi:hypothetical protein